MSNENGFEQFKGTPGYIASGPLVDAVNSKAPPPRARSSGNAASVVTSTLRTLRSIASS